MTVKVIKENYQYTSLEQKWELAQSCPLRSGQIPVFVEGGNN